jgi:hypothetical protein
VDSQRQMRARARNGPVHECMQPGARARAESAVEQHAEASAAMTKAISTSSNVKPSSSRAAAAANPGQLSAEVD